MISSDFYDNWPSIDVWQWFIHQFIAKQWILEVTWWNSVRATFAWKEAKEHIRNRQWRWVRVKKRAHGAHASQWQRWTTFVFKALSVLTSLSPNSYARFLTSVASLALARSPEFNIIMLLSGHALFAGRFVAEDTTEARMNQMWWKLVWIRKIVCRLRIRR